MKKYQIGDTVWVAMSGKREVIEPCPVCFRKKHVFLLLGNDEKVELPCSYCSKGRIEPTGEVLEYRYVAGAEVMTIDKISTEHDALGEKIRYQSNHYILYAENMFDTEAEALKRCEEVAEQINKDRISEVEHIKEDVKKSFAWNAGYHMREAKEHEKKAEMHRQKARLCRNRGDG